MTRDTDMLELSTISSDLRLPAQSPPRPLDAPAEQVLVEQEINRLTWAVLDGNASLSDRHRLAELIKRQHARRQQVRP